MARNRNLNTQNRNNNAKKQQTGQVRIIAGQYRGRKLPVLMADGLRPTTDRVKETVFNWLMPYLVDSSCLDCYSGSGSLGFEALSRGAKSITFFELNSAAAKQLDANISLLKATKATVEKGNCLDLLAKASDKFDLVFIDPPFRQNLASKTAELLNKQSLLNDNAIIYVETESEITNLQLPINWQLLKEKVSGQVAYRLYQFNAD